ncbi:hypothetical protein E2562_024603 [Oryza meyeriana var. granulata]|uniref:DUF834 domain-containing protein n=1 Tax=Oryza meyeriana var. granulata TaxID=110450 RepID=A0A6G1DMV2_9ORYZ|nr:hypothetical protein E2562_024603 [Oryza meyeriana var. granulata]
MASSIWRGEPAQSGGGERRRHRRKEAHAQAGGTGRRKRRQERHTSSVPGRLAASFGGVSGGWRRARLPLSGPAAGKEKAGGDGLWARPETMQPAEKLRGGEGEGSGGPRGAKAGSYRDFGLMW